MSQPIKIEPDTAVDLGDFDPDFHAGAADRAEAEAELDKNVRAMEHLASRLYAEHRQALLIVLQGMDTSGKDGTIRHALRGFNPLLCDVVPFKAPTETERDHDFLWRIHREVPARGRIGIFNRSHYEDIVTVRVRKLAPKRAWKLRFKAINGFERLLVHSGTTIVKCFLHISKDEQRERLQSRLDDPDKRWKFRVGDLDDRKLWDNFQQAYGDAIGRTSTEHAPWYIIPANTKWRRDLVVSRIVRETLERMDPRFPLEEEGLDGVVVE
ncbi:MAG: polyphosphate kinase 2 family protein [Pirellulales bacterium]|nr:polyphosphate kinase 2 family protein [Pirellulales bacterium]